MSENRPGFMVLRHLISSLTRHAAALGVRRCVAMLTLGALTLSLAGPLLGRSLGSSDPTYCCRAGRCCCDSGKESPDRLDFKTACSCARPDQAAFALGIPPGLLVPDATVSSPAPAELLAPSSTPAPPREAVEPPERPPRRTLLT